jgi:hypothetical protein
MARSKTTKPRPASTTPRSPSVAVTVHLSPTEHAALEAVARQRGTSVAEMLRLAALTEIRYRAG